MRLPTYGWLDGIKKAGCVLLIDLPEEYHAMPATACEPSMAPAVGNPDLLLTPNEMLLVPVPQKLQKLHKREKRAQKSAGKGAKNKAKSKASFQLYSRSVCQLSLPIVPESKPATAMKEAFKSLNAACGKMELLLSAMEYCRHFVWTTQNVPMQETIETLVSDPLSCMDEKKTMALNRLARCFQNKSQDHKKKWFRSHSAGYVIQLLSSVQELDERLQGLMAPLMKWQSSNPFEALRKSSAGGLPCVLPDGLPDVQMIGEKDGLGEDVTPLTSLQVEYPLEAVGAMPPMQLDGSFKDLDCCTALLRMDCPL